MLPSVNDGTPNSRLERQGSTKRYTILEAVTCTRAAGDTLNHIYLSLILYIPYPSISRTPSPAASGALYFESHHDNGFRSNSYRLSFYHTNTIVYA